MRVYHTRVTNAMVTNSVGTNSLVTNNCVTNISVTDIAAPLTCLIDSLPAAPASGSFPIIDALTRHSDLLIFDNLAREARASTPTAVTSPTARAASTISRCKSPIVPRIGGVIGFGMIHGPGRQKGSATHRCVINDSALTFASRVLQAVRCNRFLHPRDVHAQQAPGFAWPPGGDAGCQTTIFRFRRPR